MAIVAGGTGPYAPPAAVIEVITRYRDRGLSKPITTEVLERAGVPETLSGRTLQALKLLEFVDSEGNPSEEFDAISRAPEAEYKERLAEFIAGAYGDALAFADPATDSYDRVRDAFRGYNPKGQQERMVTLFLGLLEHAGLDISQASGSRRRAEALAKPRSNGGEKDASTKPRPKTAKVGVGKGRSGGEASQQTDTTDAGSGLPPGLVGLLRQIPTGGASWTTVRRDTFLSAFTAVLDFSVPVDDAPAPSADAEADP